MGGEIAEPLHDKQILLLDFDGHASASVGNFFQQQHISYHRVASLDSASMSVHKWNPSACVIAFSFYSATSIDAVKAAARVFKNIPLFGVTTTFSFEHATSLFRTTGIDTIQFPENESLLLPLQRKRVPVSLPLTRQYTLTVGRLARERMPLYLADLLSRGGLITDRTQFTLHLAFQEALINSLEHGNLGLLSAWKEEIDEEGRDKFALRREEHLAMDSYKNSTILVETSFDGHIIYIKIIDSGQGFRVGSVGNFPGSEIPVSCFGRGCSIILNTMDDMQYSMGGRCIEMKKIIAGDSFQWP